MPKRQYPRRSPRLPKEVTHHFTDTVNIVNILPSGSFQTGAYSFKLSDLLNASSYTALYQRYRVKSVRLRLFLNADPSTVTSGTTPQAIFMRMYSASDPNDATVPSTVAEVQLYDDMKIFQFTGEKSVHVHDLPNLRMATSPVGGGAETDTSANQWAATTSTTTAFYGWKWALDNNSLNSGSIAVYATYELEFAQPK